jgi:cell division protein FtsA
MESKASHENSEIVVGLDIGTTKIACLVARKNQHGKIEILGIGQSESAGVSRGVVSNIVNTVESIKLAVENAQLAVEKGNHGELTIAAVNVGIAGQHIKSLQHRGMLTRKSLDEEITQVDVDALIEDMYRLVMLPGEEIIHVLPQEYIVDNEQGIKDPIGMSGIRLEANFHIITGQIAAAKNINKCVEKAGLIVDDLMLEPLASASAVLSDEEKEAGVVLVDIGGGTTDVAIFHDGFIRHTAVIPFGGNVITEDIKEGCRIMRSEAEQLKVQFGTVVAGDKARDRVVIPGLKGRDPREIMIGTLSEIIKARMEEIIEHVYYEIRNSGYEKKLIGGIVVTGGGSLLRHISQLFELVTGMDTRVGYPNEHVTVSGHVQNIASPVYATGVGLVMNGFNKLEKTKVKPSGHVTGHSVKTTGSFFDKVRKMSKKLFEDDVE